MVKCASCYYFTDILSVCVIMGCSSQPYLDVYTNLYYFLAQSEEMNATDKWPGFVLTKEGENLFNKMQTSSNMICSITPCALRVGNVLQIFMMRQDLLWSSF